MSNQKTIIVQAGETIVLKAEDSGTTNKVKKPKRNTAKEREWAKNKYYRFTFVIDKKQGEKFFELLELFGNIRPLDWFREQVEKFIKDNTLNDDNSTLNVDDNNTLNVDDKPPITPQIIQKWYELNISGLSSRQIANSTNGLGYDQSTIFKRVNKLKKSMDITK